MFLTAKAVLLALAVMGVAATGAAAGTVDVPMQKAIDIHKDHLGQNSTMPEQSTNGQQKALDSLMENQLRWMAKPHNDSDDDELNDTDDDEQNETDDDELGDVDDDDQNETDDDDLDDADDDDQSETDDDEVGDNKMQKPNEIGDNFFGDAIASMLNWMKTIF